MHLANGEPHVNGQSYHPHDRVQEAISRVQQAARAEKSGAAQDHVNLVEAVRQLNLAVETPQETLMRMRFQPLQACAVRIALETGALDAIAAKHGDTITARELGKALGYDALMMERVMRQVTWCGICKEAAEATYAATETTQLIVSPGGAGGVKHHFDLFSPIAAKMMDYLHETKIHQFPNSPQQTAFEYTYGMNLWDYMQTFTEHREAFDNYMAARRVGIQKWYETFPMSTELCPGAKRDPDSVLFVDVGGNFGHEAADFHSAHPDHPGRLILQDLDSMIAKVKKEASPTGVEPMAYNFFEEQPIKGARAYYFRSICHDWDDASCETFLRNTANAMEPGYSRMLIDEYVLPDTESPIRGSSMDFLMMMFCGGIERTERQWETLLNRCGLEIVKVWGGRSDYEQIIEARIRA